MSGIVPEVANDAGDLDLMHGVNQRGGRAGLAEDVANIGDFADGRALAVQGLRYLDAEQALLAKFREGLARKAGFGIDRRSVGAGHVGGRARTGGQVALAGTWNTGTGKSVRLDCHLKLA